jgi:hypothetical protein
MPITTFATNSRQMNKIKLAQKIKALRIEAGHSQAELSNISNIINFDDNLKKILNFQITWFLIFLTSYISMLTTKIEHMPHSQFFFMAICVLYLYNITITLINAIRIQMEKPIYYTAVGFLR